MPLLQCPKGPVLEHPSRANVLRGPKHSETCTAALLFQFFINLGQIGLENISLSQI